ncbi:hypothetical protein CPB84DRAFT_1840894 [Gymnopilus junonius]|uniref:Yeast cell wall synthesis Kre9/Knh1-like N-terminal domain-containing protein n=1 Tax=Gymnopilus junonius TaxID=109634 RepID=A0A9P5P3G1_GYMJU|nr:hypothetical protein CPB84DRAFT_1840894 [Gymnopilus junonius]
MRTITLLLAFISSAFAYQVLVPNGSQGWTNHGAQLLTWERVNTDRQNFTALLTNQNITGFQPQVLAALVDGSLGKANMNPPSGGWPTGDHFRVNIVQDATDLNTILAQSVEFSITQGTSTLSSTLASSSTGGVAIPPTATGVTTPTTDGGSNASPTSPITVPTSGATSRFTLQTGLLAVMSVMAFALA